MPSIKYVGFLVALAILRKIAILTSGSQIRVFIDGFSSILLMFCQGVPQSSFLGPLEFMIYSNALLKSLTFADDTTLVHSSMDMVEVNDFVNVKFKNGC